MPVYRYKTLTAEGKNSSGVIDAESGRDARDKLRSQGLMVIDVYAQGMDTAGATLKGAILVNFTVQLEQMLDANIPLYESMRALEEQYRHETCHWIILSLCDQIKTGVPLSEAMGAFPECFDSLYRGMIASGEAVGALASVLKKLADLLTRRMKLQKQLITALIYPAIVLSFSFVAIFILLTFAVPAMEAVFDGRDVNTFTGVILAVSHNVNTFWPLYLFVIAASIVAIIAGIRSSRGREIIDAITLKMPLMRTLVVQSVVAKFTRTLATTLQGGMTMIDSLRIARGVIKNHILEEDIATAEAKIIEGSSLSEELKKYRWMPTLVPRMLAVGEESGSAAIMLDKIADIYESDQEKMLTRIIAIVTPALLVVTGCIVGAVMLAVLLPLTDASSFIGG